MFKSEILPIEFKYPWNLSLAERLKMLAKGKVRVAYYYEEVNNSTFRYRAYNMAQALNHGDGGVVSASYFFMNDLSRLNEIVELADILVICRSGYNQHINRLILKFKLKNKKVLFDIDDMVFNTSYAHLIANTLDQDLNNPGVWDYWFAYLSRMGETLKMCDGAITTNQYLANKISDFSKLPVSVIPNFMNREQIDYSLSIFQEKQNLNYARTEKITLGYFSGSPSHNLDYQIITSALESIMLVDDRVELMVVGYIEPGERIDSSRVKYHSFVDYVNLQRLIGQVEFNLMPLQTNAFTNCKSELKYFEAAIVGTLSIASPSYTYSSAINDGENGYLAKAHQWTNVINKAIDNIEKYPEMAHNAHTDAYEKYTHTNQYDAILKALDLSSNTF